MTEPPFLFRSVRLWLRVSLIWWWQVGAPRRTPSQLWRDQLHAAIDAKYALLASRRRMLYVAALSRTDALVDDATTRRTMPHRCVVTSMVHVVARIASVELSHHRATPSPRVRLRLSPLERCVRLHRSSTMGDSRIGSTLSQLAGELGARRGARADHREPATRSSGVREILRPLAARDAYGSKPIAPADGPVPTVDLEPEMAVAPRGRFDTFDQQLAFVGSVGGENQATTPERKMRDVIHWSPLGWAGSAREVVESWVLSMGLVRVQVGGRCTPGCGPWTSRLRCHSVRR